MIFFDQLKLMTLDCATLYVITDIISVYTHVISCLTIFYLFSFSALIHKFQHISKTDVKGMCL